MEFDRAPDVPVHKAIVRTGDGQYWMTIEAPAPYPYWVGGRPPASRSFTNALLRPYEKFLTTGNPVVGLVQYYMAARNVGGTPRVLLATSVRDHPTHLEEPQLLPGSLFLFPGYGQEGLSGPPGEGVQPHHISIREAEGRRILSYTHGILDDGEEVIRAGSDEEVPEGDPPPILHVASMRVDAPRMLDPAGFAYAHVPEWLVEAREDEDDFFPDLRVRNHWWDDMERDPNLMEGPHHLWMTAFLTPRLLERREIDRIVRFLLGVEQLRGWPEVELWEDYDGDVSFRTAYMDLGRLGIDAEYRYVLLLRGLVPGGLPGGVTLFGSAAPVPVSDDEWDEAGIE